MCVNRDTDGVVCGGAWQRLLGDVFRVVPALVDGGEVVSRDMDMSVGAIARRKQML